MGTSQVQAAAPSNQRSKRLVRPVTPGTARSFRPLAAMPWQRPNIGSRVTREGHARFWERPEVKFLRATRQSRPDQQTLNVQFSSAAKPDMRSFRSARLLCANKRHTHAYSQQSSCRAAYGQTASGLSPRWFGCPSWASNIGVSDGELSAQLL